MKRSNDEIFFEETKRKEIKLTCQVIITLDQTIGSRLLYRKFKYQTSELQLFLQNVPVLYWYPLNVIGTTNYDTLDACIFSAVMRINFHDYSNFDMINIMLKKLNPMSTRKQILAKLLTSLLSDELFILQALEEFQQQGGDNKNPLEYVADHWKDDDKFMLKAIKISNDSIKYLSDRLKENQQFISQSSKQQEHSEDNSLIEINRLLIEIENDQLYNDYQLFNDFETITNTGRESINFNYVNLKYASNDQLKDDEEFILEAVKENGKALIFASDRLKDNEEFILQIVKQHGYALEFASDRLKDNEKIVLEAVKESNYHAIEFASDRLKDDEEFILQIVKQNANILQFASNRLKDNEIIVLEAFKQNGNSLSLASKRLRNDLNFSKQIFNHCNNLNVFERFGEELRNIEFIFYFIENYQSKFHELMRNIKKPKSKTISALEILDSSFRDCSLSI